MPKLPVVPIWNIKQSINEYKTKYKWILNKTKYKWILYSFFMDIDFVSIKAMEEITKG